MIRRVEEKYFYESCGTYEFQKIPICDGWCQDKSTQELVEKILNWFYSSWKSEGRRILQVGKIE